MASTSLILLSRSAENPSQSAFFRLRRLLNVVGCATITRVYTDTDWAVLCVGIGSRTYFSHIREMFDDANMRSWLYPFFHIALLNDFGSFALCMSDRLFDSGHSSTTSLSLSVEVYRVCESAKISAGPQRSNKSGGPTRVLSDLLKYVTFQKLHKNACS